MKKRNLVTVAIVMFFSLISMAQPPVQSLIEPFAGPSEIARVINLSKQANEAHGVFNPNRIYPGQILTFRFSNGTQRDFVVEKGDSQWKLVGEVLKYQNANGTRVVDYDYPTPIDSPKAEKTQTNSFYSDGIPWWPLLAIGLYLLAGAVFLSSLRRRRRATDAYAHQLNVIRELRQTGGDARFIMGDLDMSVTIPTQEHVHVHITETTTIAITVTEAKTEDKPKAEKEAENKTDANTTTAAK